MKDPIYQTVFKIKDVIQELEFAALNGADSWDSYNRLIGRGQGLREALEIINGVLQEDEEEE
jgi:hypothetical protein